MHQPPGFVDPRYPHHVCLLQKSLYGLKQAPRAWFQRFTGYATRVGFYHSRCDSSRFILRQGSQKQYAIELLAHAHMTNCNPSRTPVDTDSKLGPEVFLPLSTVTASDFSWFRHASHFCLVLIRFCPFLGFLSPAHNKHKTYDCIALWISTVLSGVVTSIARSPLKDILYKRFLRDPGSLIRRRNLGEPPSLFDFKEVMKIPHNNQGPPPTRTPPPQNNNDPPLVATDFGLRHHMIQQVQNPCQFHRLPGDDANRHIDKFLEITQYMKQTRVFDDALHLSFFPYSLMHHATAWYDLLPRDSIHTFDDMTRKFLSKYFPPSMVTKLRNEIRDFRQKLNESLFEAWEHYKLSIDRCPNHNILLVTQIDMFYNGLTLRHRDTINAAAGGTFMQKTPEECYDLIENMTAHHNHWDTLATRDETSKTISSTTTTESPETCGGPHSHTECPGFGGYTQEATYATTDKYYENGNKNNFETSMAKNQNELKNLMSSFLQMKMQSPLGSGSHTSNTIANPRGDVEAVTTQSGVAYDGPMIPPTPFPLSKVLERETGATIDKVGPPKKLPEKLKDLGRFLIPCDFQGLESSMALADLGANINLMPLFVWKKLSLPDLTSTRMTLELATRSYAYPASIAEDIFVMARALVDVHREELILRNGDEQLIFHVDSTSKHPHKHIYESINMINFIDITCEDHFTEVLKFKKSNHPLSGSTTLLFDFSPSFTPLETSDSLLEEFTDKLALFELIPSGKEDNNFDFEADLKEIEFLLNQYPSTESNIETIDPILEKFTNKLALAYLPLPRDDDNDDDDPFDLKSNNDELKKLLYGYCYKDINSEKDKNKDSKMKLLNIEDHIVESNDLLP
nr:reverse transcriptase domain-containing protein [Tanacetum cinerariifolium]